MSNDNKRDPKLIIPYPPDQVKWDYPNAKDKIKLIPPPKAYETPDPLVSSVLHDAYIAWQMKNNLSEYIEKFNQMTLGEFFERVYGNLDAEVRVEMLADEVWVLYLYNTGGQAYHGMSSSAIMCLLSGISYPMAQADGYKGNEDDWQLYIYDIGRTHRERMRKRKNP